MKNVFVCMIAVVLLSLGYGKAAHFNDKLDDQPQDPWVTKESTHNPIGEQWKVLRGKWQKKESGEIIAARSQTDNNAIDLLMVQKQEIKGDKFSISAKLKNLASAKTSLIGLAFHVQDANNYYAFRFNAADEEGGYIQIIRVIEGKAQQVFVQRHEGKIKEKEFYVVKINSDELYSFSWSISDLEGNVIVEGKTKDRLKQFKGGSVGMYAHSAGEFSDFSQSR